MIFLLTLSEFMCGSLMFSYWLGLAAKRDIRRVGDGNPGAYNLWKAVGYKFGILGVFLDFIKGYFPLVLLIELNFIKGSEIIPIAIAPILGHAFSPFMKFRGGKAISVSFGVWSAVTRFQISIAFAVCLAVLSLAVKVYNHGKPASTEVDALMNTLGMLVIMIYILLLKYPHYISFLWLFNLIIFAYKNNDKLYNLYKIKMNKTEIM